MVRLKSEEIVIDPKHPFKKDLLDRGQYANVLTQIVKNCEGGFTLSINADWGYGKTTFIKMWEASLQNEGYKTIYFNAWESDFVADPMIALIDGIINGIGKTLKRDKKTFISALGKSLIQLGKLVPGLHSYAEIAETIQNGVDKLSDEEACLKEYRGIKNVVDDFRAKLAEYAKKVGKDKPLIIFVDELDRCRPDYAVQMLERIKHFFEIENIIFVLSIDKKVFCKSIKAVYGGLEIDTEAYLRRFVDLDFNIPEPQVSDFIKAQYMHHQIEALFDAYQEYNRRTYGDGAKSDKLLEEIQICFAATNHSLRDVEKYFNRLEVILQSLQPDYLPLGLVVHVLYIYMFRLDVYQKYHALSYKTDELWAILQEMIEASKINSTTDSNSQYWYENSIIQVLAFYVCQLIRARKKDEIIERIEEHNDSSWLPIDYQQRFDDCYNATKRIHNIDDLYQKIEFVSANFSWRVINGVIDK